MASNSFTIPAVPARDDHDAQDDDKNLTLVPRQQGQDEIETRTRMASTDDFVSKLGMVFEVAPHVSDGSAQDQMLNSAYDTMNDPDIDMLLQNNKIWVQRMNEQDGEFFHRLGQGQAPKFLYFGCSDSRVPANQILGLSPGEVFVHRNVGNLCPANDLNSLTVLEYAVEYLDVRHIIVTGHYECGAINASLKAQDHGLIENWIRNIRDVYRLHHKKLDLIKDLEERKRRLVELNVIEQCLNLYKTGVVQRKRTRVFQEGKSPFVYPRIHGLVFDPKVGILRKLPIDFRSQVETYKHIYNLYELPEPPKPVASPKVQPNAQPNAQPNPQPNQHAHTCDCNAGN
eukprot:c4493_g1_i1.p1 GENE.c4493_g1_i1~~c4493_g1_i1.p1  ORF type:complete len:358 (-),score=81.31 c4493_g1_i1:271-1296(-)